MRLFGVDSNIIMKLEQNKLELAARLFFAKDSFDPVTNEIQADKLPEVKLYRQFTSENNRNAELNMYTIVGNIIQI